MNHDVLDLLARSSERSLERSLAMASLETRDILARTLEGRELDVSHATLLLSCSDEDLPAIAAAANQVRKQRVGDDVSFVITRNINFTNVCYMGCRFCGFAKRREAKDAYWIDFDEVAHRAQVA